MENPATRLRAARLAAGFATAADAATRHGWSLNTYKANENGNAPFSFRRAKDYGAAFGVSAEWLYDGAEKSAAALPAAPLNKSVGDPVNLADVRRYLAGFASPAPAPSAIRRQIPVVGDVAAGRWLEVQSVEAGAVTEFLPMDVAGYERATLKALRVVGPSMNLVYPEGRYVVIADAWQAGVRDGDFVVVERQRAGLVEVTLKELVVEDGGRIALWPRSNHPDFQAPIYLETSGEADQTAPQIIGVVVADFGHRNRPPARQGTI